MPRRRAVSFMRWANAASEPETFSPSAAATSFSERTTRAVSAVSTVIVPPTGTPRWPAYSTLSALLGDRDRVAAQAAGLHLLEHDVHRHELGERRGIPGGAGIALQQGLAGRRIDHEIGPGHDRAGGRRDGPDLRPGRPRRTGPAGASGRSRKRAFISTNSCHYIALMLKVMIAPVTPFQQNCSIVWD